MRRRSSHLASRRADPHDGTNARSYVVYGTVPWESPWLSEQNLAHALERHGTVLYVEPPLSPLSPFRSTSAGRRGRALRRVLRRRPQYMGGVYVFRPLAVPGVHSHGLRVPVARALANAVERRQVARGPPRSSTLGRPRRTAGASDGWCGG